MKFDAFKHCDGTVIGNGQRSICDYAGFYVVSHQRSTFVKVYKMSPILSLMNRIV